MTYDDIITRARRTPTSAPAPFVGTVGDKPLLLGSGTSLAHVSRWRRFLRTLRFWR